MEHGNRSNIPAKILKSAMESVVLIPFQRQSSVDENRVQKILLDIIQDVHHPSIGKNQSLNKLFNFPVKIHVTTLTQILIHKQLTFFVNYNCWLL